jgi:hypothetical protein
VYQHFPNPNYALAMRTKTATQIASLAVILASVQAAYSELITIPPGNVTASSEIGGTFNRIDDFIVNGNGLNISGEHTPAVEPNMWLSTGTGFGGIDADPSVTFDLGAVYTISSFHVWNYNEAPPLLVNRGVNDVSVEFGTTAGLGSTVPGITNFAIADGTDTYTGENFSSFTPFDARFIKFDINSNHGDANTFYGLSEVQFDGVLASDPDTTWSLAITPADSGYDLAWASQGGMLYNVRSSPDLIGEISTWTLVQGDIEATPDSNTFQVTPTESRLFYAVEEYPAGDQIDTIEFFDDVDDWYWVWNDGTAFGLQSVAAVADPDAERGGTVVQFDYDNSGADGSDVVFQLDGGSVDLSQYDEMILWKKCAVGNTLETKLYLHIHDSNDDESARVEIRNGGARMSTVSEDPGVWLQWTIDLHSDLDFSKSEGRASSLADITDFDRFLLGCWSSGGGTGTIYFDDLQLIKRR